MLDALLQRYPGYTLRTLLQEDAHELLQMLAVLAQGRREDSGPAALSSQPADPMLFGLADQMVPIGG